MDTTGFAAVMSASWFGFIKTRRVDTGVEDRCLVGSIDAASSFKLRDKVGCFGGSELFETVLAKSLR